MTERRRPADRPASGTGPARGGASRVLRAALACLLVVVALVSAAPASAAPARQSRAGTVDRDFVPPRLDGSVNAAVLQPDGTIVIAGSFTTCRGRPCPHVARLHPDGTWDRSFALTGSGLDGAVNALVRQADGRLVVGGEFRSYDRQPREYVARLNPDGSLDPTFNAAGSGLDASVQLMGLQSDGKVVVTGAFFPAGSPVPHPQTHVVRLTADGVVDPTFTQTGLYWGSDLYALALQPDGKVLIGGSFWPANGGVFDQPSSLARLNPDGSFDPTFRLDARGPATSEGVSSVALQADGRILTVWEDMTANDNFRTTVGRLNPDGSRDDTFRARSPRTIRDHGVAVQPDGKVLVSYLGGPWRDQWSARVRRLEPDGSRDRTFCHSGLGAAPRSRHSIEGMLTQPDGGVVVYGFFRRYNGVPRLGVARLEP